MDNDLVCGIDLGTSNTLCAVMYDNKRELVHLRDGKTAMPSTVQYRKNGDVNAGIKVKAPDSVVISYAKRLIGISKDGLGTLGNISYGSPLVEMKNNMVGFLLDFGDRKKELSPVDVEANILEAIYLQLKKMYLSKDSTKLTTVVVGVPAKFNQLQRECILKACSKVFDKSVCVRLLDEPVAAIIHYFSNNNVEKSGKYLIYDFGAGTFDLTLVEYQNKFEYKILDVDGNDKLGGADIDRIIFDYVCMCIKRQFHIDLGQLFKDNPRIKEDLLQKCEELKMTIGEQNPGQIDISEIVSQNGTEEPKIFSISLKIFNSLIHKTVQNTLDIMEGLFKKYKKEEIEAVILVGGTSSIPYISKALTEKFGIKINQNISKIDCVAIGACIYANTLQTNEEHVNWGNSISVKARSRYALGVAVYEGKVFPLIQKGDLLPCHKSMLFTTTEDYQEYVSTGIYEGEGTFQKNCRLLKVIKFYGITKAKQGVPRIKIEYSVDASSNLTVTCSEMINDSTFKTYISETLIL